MTKTKINQKGFSAFEAILIIVILILIGAVGYLVYKNHHKSTVANVTSSSTTSTTATTTTTTKPAQTTKTVDRNAGYLVVKEWGLRFKIPSGLTDVKYAIHEDTLAFFAKPTGSSVQYRSDYDKFTDGNFQYATGVLYRSTDSTESRPDRAVQGKKVGNYYYYTAWSFSGLATGAACVELYGSSSDSNCKAGSTAFALVNGNDGNNKALLMTIQLAQ